VTLVMTIQLSAAAFHAANSVRLSVTGALKS
jgi:hypothetical protein